LKVCHRGLPFGRELWTEEEDDFETGQQGSTGVLKTSRLPTWVVNFGVGYAHPKILLDAGFAWATHLSQNFCAGK